MVASQTAVWSCPFCVSLHPESLSNHRYPPELAIVSKHSLEGASPLHSFGWVGIPEGKGSGALEGNDIVFGGVVGSFAEGLFGSLLVGNAAASAHSESKLKSIVECMKIEGS